MLEAIVAIGFVAVVIALLVVGKGVAHDIGVHAYSIGQWIQASAQELKNTQNAKVEERVKNQEKKIALLIDRVKDAQDISSDMKRIGNVGDTLLARMSEQEKEVGAIYVQLQRLEQAQSSAAAKEIDEIASMMKEAGMAPPRGEKTHMPQVMKAGTG